MPNNAPYSAIDIPKVMSRNLAARDIVSGFATRSNAVRRVAAPSGRTDRHAGPGRGGKPAVRRAGGRALRHANALAAMRATIGAQRDGEPDPLYYIRDELSAPQNLSEAREGGRQ